MKQICLYSFGLYDKNTAVILQFWKFFVNCCLTCGQRVNEAQDIEKAPLLKGDFTVLMGLKPLEDIGTILFDKFFVAIERVVIAAGDAV